MAKPAMSFEQRESVDWSWVIVRLKLQVTSRASTQFRIDPGHLSSPIEDREPIFLRVQPIFNFIFDSNHRSG